MLMICGKLIISRCFGRYNLKAQAGEVESIFSYRAEMGVMGVVFQNLLPRVTLQICGLDTE